jgi:hypothetical protein
MPTITKPYTYANGATIKSSEVNANEDALYTAVNGNLDQDNLKNTTQIPNSYLAEIQPDTTIDAHADDATEYLTATTPGYTASPSLPAKLSDELERYRYRILANNGLLTASYVDSSSVQQTIGWVEPPIVGPQLFLNNGFEVKTSGSASAAPDNWTLEGTPTSLVITAPGLLVPAVGLNKRALRITYRAVADEGIKQTLSGLKASTKYVVGIAHALVSGTPTVKVNISGALASGNYRNGDTFVATVGTAIAYFQTVFQTTTTGDPVTVKLINGGSSGSDVLDMYQVWAFEMKDQSTLTAPHIPMQTATSSTATDVLDAATGTWTTISGLTLAQYIPMSGYRLHYECSISYAAKLEGTMPETCDSGVRIQMDVSGGGYNTVQGPFSFRNYSVTGDNQLQFTNRETMHHVIENPTSGSTYTFHADLGVFDGGSNAADLVVNPDYSASGMGQSRSEAKLWLERL